MRNEVDYERALEIIKSWSPDRLVEVWNTVLEDYRGDTTERIEDIREFDYVHRYESPLDIAKTVVKSPDFDPEKRFFKMDEWGEHLESYDEENVIDAVNIDEISEWMHDEGMV